MNWCFFPLRRKVTQRDVSLKFSHCVNYGQVMLISHTHRQIPRKKISKMHNFFFPPQVTPQGPHHMPIGRNVFFTCKAVVHNPELVRDLKWVGPNGKMIPQDDRWFRTKKYIVLNKTPLGLKTEGSRKNTYTLKAWKMKKKKNMKCFFPHAKCAQQPQKSRFFTAKLKLPSTAAVKPAPVHALLKKKLSPITISHKKKQNFETI